MKDSFITYPAFNHLYWNFSGQFKFLGINFSKNVDEMLNLNYDQALIDIQKTYLSGKDGL